MLKGVTPVQVVRGSSLTTDELQSGLTAMGHAFDLIGSEYKRLDKSGEFVYTVFFNSDACSDTPVDATDVYVNFINENTYEVDFY